jgi:hypothetical protein
MCCVHGNVVVDSSFQCQLPMGWQGALLLFGDASWMHFVCLQAGCLGLVECLEMFCHALEAGLYSMK